MHILGELERLYGTEMPEGQRIELIETLQGWEDWEIENAVSAWLETPDADHRFPMAEDLLPYRDLLVVNG